MEKRQEISPSKDDSSQELLPSLIKAIAEHEVAGFDGVEEHAETNPHPLTRVVSSGMELAAEIEDVSDMCEPRRLHSVSISMPPSPLEAHIHKHKHKAKRVLFDNDSTILVNDNTTTPPNTKKTIFYSQPIPKGPLLHDSLNYGNSAPLPPPIPRINKLRDKRYDSFKTWSGKLERQICNLRGRARRDEPDSHTQHHVEMGTVPVDRYFDALEGPELDVLRPSEEILLPEDKQWPFLLRFPVSSFGIILGVSSQAIMWKTIASSESTKFLHIGPLINQIFWFIAIALMVIVTCTYSLKLIFYWEAVRREYHHPIRVNFFFAPWIALLFLAMGIPPSIAQTLHKSLWYILMAPIFCLELKIYGQWMSGGQRRLSKVANPSNHLSVVGNFVGALLGATMGIKEGPIFFFAIGLAHYIVLFVTLYQRLPTNETLPKELHPVFFLFVAAPSVASMAWAKIVGSFDNGSKMAFFIAMFLYFSLAIRVNFFRGFRFSLAWWAYTFPMTGAAIASIRYSSAVDNTVTRTFAVILCIVACLIVAALLVTTVIHAVLGSLFPNDISIAISERRRRPKSSTTRRWFHRRGASSDASVDQYLKYSEAKDKGDIETAGPVPPLP